MGEFTKNFFIDPGIIIKEEPLRDQDFHMITTSASVPIPTRRAMEISDYRDYTTLELDNSQSPLYQDSHSVDPYVIIPDPFHSTTMWGNRVRMAEECLKSEEHIHMDDDDIFQVDKADLIQGPTLAELNANDDSLLGVGELNFDDLLLPEEGSTSYLTLSQKMFHHSNSNSNHANNNSPILSASSCPQSGMLFYKDLDLASSAPPHTFDLMCSKTPHSPFSPSSSNNSPSIQSSPVHQGSLLQQKHSTLHELLMKRESYVSPERATVSPSSSSGFLPVPGHRTPSSPSPNTGIMQHKAHASRLSSSAPTRLGLTELWQRREPRKHLISTGSLAEAESTSSLSTGGILSPDPQDYSHDEFDDSDDESDADHHYEDVSSDNDSDDEHPNSASARSASKKERYFWQYNVQAKGPKGQRLVMKSKMEDPHVLHQVTDPVFSPSCSVRGIKHSGKARKGDGNDLTPNARKLFNIGKELDKLGRIINDMTPVSELPFNVRPKSRKEKNKLASRACRLKKKAQHEANKIKLSGLEVEHRNILNGIAQSKEMLLAKLQEPSPETQNNLSLNIDSILKNSTKTKVAGHTTDYVNKILDRLKKGLPLTVVDEHT